MALGQADRAAHALRDRRRRDGDAEARGDPVVGLEEPEPAAQALGELGPLVVGQAGGEAGRRLVVGGAGRLDALAAAVGEGDDRAAAVVGVALARDVAGALEPRETDAQRPARAPDVRHEVALGEVVVLGAEERQEDEVARTRQAVLVERLLELGLEVGRGPDHVVDEDGAICLLRHKSCSECLVSSELAKA